MDEKYASLQPLFYNYFIKCIDNNKISHAYMIETKNVSYSVELALLISYKILSFNNNIIDKEQIKKLINNGSYPDLKIIDSDSLIKKDEILELENLFSRKPLYGKYMVYIIKDATKLNSSSSNALLKFLEEPQKGVIAILLANNVYRVIDTIVSRCQIVSLLPENDSLSLLMKKYLIDDSTIIDELFKFYNDLNKHGTNMLVHLSNYNLHDNFILFLDFGLRYYYDILNYKYSISLKYFNDRINDISSNAKFLKENDVIKKINTINSFINNSSFNVNKDLFIDNFIISMNGGVLCD